MHTPGTHSLRIAHCTLQLRSPCFYYAWLCGPRQTQIINWQRILAYLQVQLKVAGQTFQYMHSNNFKYP